MTQTTSEEMSKLEAWKTELRAGFLTGSILPMVVGSLVALSIHGVLQWDVLILTLVAGICLHIGANVSNDYFDHDEEGSGTDDINVNFIRPFTGGSRMIQKGFLKPKEVLVGSLIFFGLGSAIGLYLAFKLDLFIIILGIIGAASGFFYTAPPLELVKRGVGEFFIGLNFGVLMTFGGYFVQALDFHFEAVFASVPLAILITAILFINEFPDFKADKAAGKRTLVVRMGLRKSSRFYAVMIFSVYAYVVLAVGLQLITLFSLLVLSTLPIGIFAIKHTSQNYADSRRLAPANASTVFLHLLVGILFAAAYLLEFLNATLPWLIVISIVFLTISGLVTKKLSTPPAPPH